MAKKIKKGGVITDNMGQYNHPGKVTKINSNRITMKGIPYPVLGVSNTGHKQLMNPEGEYAFRGKSVTEYPLLQGGGILPTGTMPITNDIRIPDDSRRKDIDLILQEQYPGIPLEQLDRYNTPIYPGVPDTPKQAAARRGLAPLSGKPNYTPSTSFIAGTHVPKPNTKNKKQPTVASYQVGGTAVLNPGAQQVSLTDLQPQNTIYPIQGQPVPTFFQDQTFANQGTNKWGVREFLGNNGPIASGMQKANSALKPVGGIGGALNVGMDLAQGFSMLKGEKDQRKEAQQTAALSDLTLQAASIRPDKPKRKYVRPEDQIIDPNTVANSYGVGSNFLKKGGKVKKAQFGQQLGSFGSMIGSKIFGGTGEAGGAGKIGSTVGSTIGSVFGPVGGAVGGFLGGAIGGAFGAKGQKETQGYEDQANANFQNAAFQQGVQGIQNQYTGFMKNGGNTDMGGDLQPIWGGNAEHVSTNPYLPDGGESVLFRGQSHDNGGIGVKFGKSTVEVEGGEPAQKLDTGGDVNSLTVFGDMKIPAYGASEIGDDSAKGRKFKSYINDLNKVEKKQNKIIDNAFTLIDEANPSDVYDKLKISSGQAMLTGGDMKLKEVAKKKQMASIVQNAILETAEEHGLKSDALAEGKFRKAKKGAIIPLAQQGKQMRYITEDQVDGLLKQGYYQDPNNPIRYVLDPTKDTTIPGQKGEVYKPRITPAWQALSKEEKAARNAKTKQMIATDPRYKNSPDTIIPGDPGDEVYLRNYKESPTETVLEDTINPTPNIQGVGLGGFLGAYMPFIRPSNKLSKPDLSPEMFSLASNQLDPVQAQLYRPLLENVADVSYQDQLNANQADFNAISKQSVNNPAALAALAGQKYAANSSVLGEQFRQNTNNRLGTYNRNRATLNDATLKNLQILDQQYVRQSTAKSNTKAIAQSALSSIADKIGKNKLENRVLALDQQRYNYRFGPHGMAWNLNGPAQFNTQGLNLPIYDPNAKEVTTETLMKTDGKGNPAGTQVRKKVKEELNKKNPKAKNGSLVKAYHS